MGFKGILMDNALAKPMNCINGSLIEIDQGFMQSHTGCFLIGGCF